MDGSQIIAENVIRDAMERGVFDNLPGKGKPLDLSHGPFDDPLAPTLRRILRDCGATHPLLQARQAIEDEIENCRAQLRRAYAGGQGGAVWGRAVSAFRQRIATLNRDIRANNLRAPIPNLVRASLDVDAEIRGIAREGE